MTARTDQADRFVLVDPATNFKLTKNPAKISMNVTTANCVVHNPVTTTQVRTHVDAELDSD